MKSYPYDMGGGEVEIVLAMLKGAQQVLWLFLCGSLKF